MILDNYENQKNELQK